jgi:hypothetical protein
VYPTNERETLLLFASLSSRLGWHILYRNERFPDTILGNGVGANLRAEFEFRAQSFQKHRHDPKGCDLIVCWENNWPGALLPIWSLRGVLKSWGEYDAVNECTASDKNSNGRSCRYTFTIDAIKDDDLLQWLEGQANTSAAVREALRAWVDRPTHQVLDEKLDRVRFARGGGLVGGGWAGKTDTAAEPARARAGLNALKARFGRR